MPTLTTTDAVTAAVRHLRSLPEVTATVGSDPQLGPWIFRHNMYASAEGHDLPAVVLTQSGGHMVPSRYHSTSFPRLNVRIHADDPDAILDAYTAMDNVLHVPAGGAIEWAGVRVISSTRLMELDIAPVEDSTLHSGIASYAVVLG